MSQYTSDIDTLSLIAVVYVQSEIVSHFARISAQFAVPLILYDNFLHKVSHDPVKK
jgi:dihydrodipicolinate synthase/N-acetylneuraminate lyase